MCAGTVTVTTQPWRRRDFCPLAGHVAVALRAVSASVRRDDDSVQSVCRSKRTARLGLVTAGSAQESGCIQAPAAYSRNPAQSAIVPNCDAVVPDGSSVVVRIVRWPEPPGF